MHKYLAMIAITGIVMGCQPAEPANSGALFSYDLYLIKGNCNAAQLTSTYTDDYSNDGIIDFSFLRTYTWTAGNLTKYAYQEDQTPANNFVYEYSGFDTHGNPSTDIGGPDANGDGVMDSVLTTANITYTYDTAGNQTSETYVRTPYTDVTTKTYDSNNRLTSSTYQSYNNSTLTYTTIKTYTFDSNGHLSQYRYSVIPVTGTSSYIQLTYTTTVTGSTITVDAVHNSFPDNTFTTPSSTSYRTSIITLDANNNLVSEQRNFYADSTKTTVASTVNITQTWGACNSAAGKAPEFQSVGGARMAQGIAPRML